MRGGCQDGSSPAAVIRVCPTGPQCICSFLGVLGDAVILGARGVGSTAPGTFSSWKSLGLRRNSWDGATGWDVSLWLRGGPPPFLLARARRRGPRLSAWLRNHEPGSSSPLRPQTTAPAAPAVRTRRLPGTRLSRKAWMTLGTFHEKILV